MSAATENALDAGQGIEGNESNPQQEGDSMPNHRPSAGEIAETAFVEGYRTLTIAQAVKIQSQLDDMIDPGYDREDWCELAMFAAQNLHERNTVNLAAAGIAEIGAPRGFDADHAEDWALNNSDRATRWWVRQIGDSAASISVRVIDEITEGRIIRRAPHLHINVEGAFTASETHEIIDDLQTAIRALAEIEEVDA